MKMIRRSGLLLLVSAALLSAFDLPRNWHKAGTDPGKYDMSVAKGAAPNGGNAATIRSTEKDIDGFGTLMQSCSPSRFLGKRVRMSGQMKSLNVAKWASFWFRVDQAGSNAPLSFDNMEKRAIKGTTDWKQYEIVLDVPVNASNLAYGALIDGTGQIWFSDLKFEVVDASVSSTNMMEKEEVLTEPTNLDFKQ